MGWSQKAHFHFIQKRKVAYVFSSILILAGIASFFNGFNYGVEFDGGRSQIAASSSSGKSW